jgi:hypothetical protein
MTTMRLPMLVAVICWSGCSFLFVSGPPPHYDALPTFSCTESQVAPILDAVATILNGSDAVIAATESSEQWVAANNGHPPSRAVTVAVNGVTALVWAASAYYGYTRTSACRDARLEIAMRAARVPPGQAREPSGKGDENPTEPPASSVRSRGTSWGRPLLPQSPSEASKRLPPPPPKASEL